MGSNTLLKRILSHATKYHNIRIITKLDYRSVSHTSLNDCSNNDEHQRQSETNTKRIGLFVGSAICGLAAYEYYKKHSHNAFLAAKSQETEAGEFIKGLPTYTMEEVAKHTTIKDKIWVTYKRGVYDVTAFAAEHPGGDNILLAAGGSVEPFWLLYAVHKNPQVFAMLERLRIGNISEADASEATRNMSDPYSGDPRRHPILKPASAKPFNAEPPASLLVDSFITPNEFFYVRNHLPVPEVDPATYELEIECEGRSKTFTLSLSDLKRFPAHTITSTIMCAGNRRSEMTRIKAVKGLDWQNAAIGNATWTGARLVDVLRAAGIDNPGDYQHIQFEGLDTDPTSKPYAASIPIWKAFDERADVLLAYEMNGAPITRDHGFPVRVIVPGVVGARNVKWLGRVVLAHAESDSHWQQNDYKGFSPSVDWDTVDFTQSPAIQELPVVSSICRPVAGERVRVVDGAITVQGYAWSGGGQRIVRVDVTADGGDTWHVAHFDQQDASAPPRHWAWTLWTVKLPVPAKARDVEIWAKAVDSNYNTQPETFKNIWNLRGVLGNAYHRVRVNLSW